MVAGVVPSLVTFLSSNRILVAHLGTNGTAPCWNAPFRSPETASRNRWRRTLNRSPRVCRTLPEQTKPFPPHPKNDSQRASQPNSRRLPQRSAPLQSPDVSVFLFQALWNGIERANDHHRVSELCLTDSEALDASMTDREVPNRALRTAVASDREHNGVDLMQSLLVDPLDPTHERSRVDCGNDALDTRLRTGVDRHVS